MGIRWSRATWRAVMWAVMLVVIAAAPTPDMPGAEPPSPPAAQADPAEPTPDSTGGGPPSAPIGAAADAAGPKPGTRPPSPPFARAEPAGATMGPTDAGEPPSALAGAPADPLAPTPNAAGAGPPSTPAIPDDPSTPTAGAAGGGPPLGGEGSAVDARYAWPLRPQPAVLTPFGAPDDPFGPGHRGVDLAGTVGQPVLAARGGTVVFAGPVAGHGVVSVQHDDGLRTTYEPLVPAVHAGAVVATGDVLGALTVGHRGCAAVCLHWGVRRDRFEYLDPLVLLGPLRVRLLPVPEPWPDP